MAKQDEAELIEIPLRQRIWHHTKQVLALGGSLGLMVGAVVLAGEVSWAWPAVMLPILYLAAAVLYRFEHRLPGWASCLLDLAADRVFTISWLAKMDTVRETNVELLGDLNLTLREYGLGDVKAAARNAIARRGKILRLKHAAVRMAELPSPAVDALTVELLYRERCGIPTINLWQTHKKWFVARLPEVLPKSERLPLAPVDGAKATSRDLTELLPALRDFDVELVASELRILADLRERVLRYVRFLERNGIATRLEDPEDPEVPEERDSSDDRDSEVVTLRHVKSKIHLLPSGTSTLFRLEDAALALDLLMERDCSKDDVSKMVHVGVFLTEREESDVAPLIERLCRLAMNAGTMPPRPSRAALDQGVLTVEADEPDQPELIAMLHAYLLGKEKARCSPLLRDFDESWTAWADDAKAEPDKYKQEVEDLRSELMTGSWPNAKSGSSYMTVEVTLTHDEVRDIDLYLVTTDVATGPVSDLIKSLKATPDERPDLVQLGIELEYNGRQKYRFDNFTKNTQLGVIPRGMPFHDFYEGFVRDVDILLRNRDRTLPDVKWLPRLADMVAVEKGKQRTTRLWETGRGPVEFKIVEQPRHGKLLDDLQPSADGTSAEVTYEASLGTNRYTCDSFTYRATGPHRKDIERKVHLFLHPPYTDERPGGVISVQYGKPRLITLRDKQKGLSTFRVITPPEYGALGEVKQKNDDQAVVIYMAEKPADDVEHVRYDEFEYEAESLQGKIYGYNSPVRLLVYPEGVMQLSQFEITLDRVDPDHCHELWFGDTQLGSRARPPSVCDVWNGIKSSLDPAEYDDMKRLFDRIAGGAGCIDRPLAEHAAMQPASSPGSGNPPV